MCKNGLNRYGRFDFTGLGSFLNVFVFRGHSVRTQPPWYTRALTSFSSSHVRVGGLSLSVEHRRRHSSGIVFAWRYKVVRVSSVLYSWKLCENNTTISVGDKSESFFKSKKQEIRFVQNRERSSCDYTEPARGSRWDGRSRQKKKNAPPAPYRRGLFGRSQLSSIKVSKSAVPTAATFSLRPSPVAFYRIGAAHTTHRNDLPSTSE